MVKNVPAMLETQVLSLGGEDPLEKGSPVFLPGEFCGQRTLAGYSPWVAKIQSRMSDLVLSVFSFSHL